MLHARRDLTTPRACVARASPVAPSPSLPITRLPICRARVHHAGASAHGHHSGLFIKKNGATFSCTAAISRSTVMGAVNGSWAGTPSRCAPALSTANSVACFLTLCLITHHGEYFRWRNHRGAFTVHTREKCSSSPPFSRALRPGGPYCTPRILQPRASSRTTHFASAHLPSCKCRSCRILQGSPKPNISGFWWMDFYAILRHHLACYTPRTRTLHAGTGLLAKKRHLPLRCDLRLEQQACARRYHAFFYSNTRCRKQYTALNHALMDICATSVRSFRAGVSRRFSLLYHGDMGLPTVAAAQARLPNTPLRTPAALPPRAPRRSTVHFCLPYFRITSTLRTISTSAAAQALYLPHPIPTL